MSEEKEKDKSENQIPNSKYPWQWKPGQSGNPLGRPKKEQYLPERIEKFLKSPLPKSYLQCVPKDLRNNVHDFLDAIIACAADEYLRGGIKKAKNIEGLRLLLEMALKHQKIEITGPFEGGEFVFGWRSRPGDEEKGPI